MKKLNLNLPDKKIDVFAGEGAADLLALPRIKKLINDNVFIVADKNALKLFGDLINGLASEFPRSYVFPFNATEKNKTFAGIEKIYSTMLKKNFGRDTTVVAIGGGVTGDAAGFVAATFSRGVKLVQIPTTLLAAVDSSIGGKTGINFADTKNIIGSFYQPESILIDSRFIKTLDKRELVSGLGEVIKYAFLTNEKFFNFISKNIDKFFSCDKKALNKIILDSVKIKISVVEQDEMETGLRQILNLGHTFAHAYEIEKNYTLRHGEAVIAGIVSAILLSEKMGLSATGLKEKYFRLLAAIPQLAINLKGINASSCYKVMLHDKKNRDGKVKFVLPIDFGEYAIGVEAGRKDIVNSIKETSELFSR